MFFFIAKRLVGNEIIDAATLLRTKGISQKIKNDTFKNLRETFNPLIFNILKKVKTVSPYEAKDIQNFIEIEFFHILTAPNLELENERKFKTYLKQVLNRRVNLGSVADYLGKTPIVRDVWRDELVLKGGLKKYIKKHKKYPNFKIQNDVRELALLMGKKEKVVRDMLSSLDPSTISSIYKEVGSSETDKNIKILLDTLKSDKPLPDKIVRNREMMSVLLQIINTLKPDERKVWKRYYQPDSVHKTKVTKDELAKELATEGWTYGKVKKTLDNANYKIKRHKLSDELRNANFKNNMVKYAMFTYDIAEENGKEMLVNINKMLLANKENIINDVLKSYKH